MSQQPNGLTGRFFERFKRRAEQYREDPQKAVELGERALRKAERNKSALDKVWSDLQTLFRLVKAWATRRYTRIPVRSIVLSVAALIYFVSPADAVPDLIAGLGLLDDATVLGFVISGLRHDLDDFREWEEEQSAPEAPATTSEPAS